MSLDFMPFNVGDLFINNLRVKITETFTSIDLLLSSAGDRDIDAVSEETAVTGKLLCDDSAGMCECDVIVLHLFFFPRISAKNQLYYNIYDQIGNEVKKIVRLQTDCE
jgi:hypothetical protein